MPDRADMLAILDRFRDAGMTPVLCTNGTNADGDIVHGPRVEGQEPDVEVTLGKRVPGQAKPPILDVQLTQAGQARLEKAGR